MKQDSLYFSSGKAFFVPLGPLPSKVPLPRRKVPGEVKRLFVHYAFDRIHLYPPPRPRVRKAKLLIIDDRFVDSNILPYPEWPLCCKLTRLPAFVDEKELAKWSDPGHCPTLMKWICRFCKMIHIWTSAPNTTDTNGNFSAGSDEAPTRMVIEFLHPGNERLFWFRHKLKS